MLLVDATSSSPVHAAQCVHDYLTTVLPLLEQTYLRARKSLQVGFVPISRYSEPKNLSKWGSELRSSEVGEIRRRDLAPKHWLSKWVKKVNSQGGEVRLLQFEEFQPNPQMQDKWKRIHEFGAYFSSDPETKVPYIAISSAVTPDTFAHEFDHLEKWIRKRNDLVSNKRLDLQSAGDEATRIFLDDVDGKRSAERTAVRKE
ncbi:MAG: hypothetical protein ACJ763_17170, partial [Bdellovibrionia bacterium]